MELGSQPLVILSQCIEGHPHEAIGAHHARILVKHAICDLFLLGKLIGGRAIDII